MRASGGRRRGLNLLGVGLVVALLTGGFAAPATAAELPTPSSTPSAAPTPPPISPKPISPPAATPTPSAVPTPTPTATPTAPSAPNAVQAASGGIRGTVTSATTGQPLFNVLVSLSAGGIGQEQVFTDGAGRYSFAGLRPADWYTVSFYDSSTLYATEFWKDARDYRSATRITVGTTTVKGIDAALEQRGSISGTVRDDAGRAVAGVEVLVSLLPNAGSSPITRTDSAGRYRFTALDPGSYSVRFFPPGTSGLLGEWWNDQPTAALATPLVVKPGVETTKTDARLSAPATLSGRVFGPGSARLPEVEVELTDAAGEQVGRTETDTRGAYQFTGLRAGTYYLGYDLGREGYYPEWWKGKTTRASATPIVVTAGQTRSDLDVALMKGAEISGTVTAADTGEGIYWADVTLYRPDGTVAKRALSDAEGHYSFDDLRAGDYTVRFDPAAAPFVTGYAAQWSGGSSLRSTASVVSVPANRRVTGVDASLGRGGSIAGTVKSVAPLRGVAGADVVVVDADGAVVGFRGTSSSGVFTIASLAAGRYTVRAAPPDDSLQPGWYGGSTAEAATVIVVTAGLKSTGANVRLQHSATVTGRVQDAAGTPLAGVTVTVWSTGASGDALVGSVTTGSDGSYRATGLPAGRVKVGFTDHAVGEAPGGRFADAYWRKASSLATATAFTATAGETVSGISVTVASRPEG